MSALPYAVAAWLFAVGLYGIVTSRNYIHLVGCLGVCQSATYVLLLAVGYRWDAVAPIFYDHPPGTPAVDPVVQALVLTDIVVGAALTALMLVMAIQVHKRRGTIDPEALRPMVENSGGDDLRGKDSQGKVSHGEVSYGEVSYGKEQDAGEARR